MSNTPDNLAATDAAILGRFQELQQEFGPAFLEEFRSVEREQLSLQGETWIDGQEPLSFDEFCIALDGRALYPRQRALFEKAGLISPYSVIDPKRKCREIVALWGKGSGKDYTIAKLMAWVCYVVLSLKGSAQERCGLAPDAPLYIVNVATNEKQALTVFFNGYLKPFLQKAIFQRWLPQATFKADEVYFPQQRLHLFSGNSRSQGMEGYNILCWIMDEADAFLDNEDRSNADEIHRIFRSSATTRMRLVPPIGVIMTYTRTKDGFALRHYAKVSDDPLFACDLAATWEVRPDFDRNDPDVVWDYENNPAEARAMYECRPMETEGAWFEFSEKIDQAVDPSLYPIADCEYSYNPVEIRNGDVVEHVSVVVANLRPRPGRLYFLGGDGGKSGDSYALAVFHIDQSEEAALWLCPRCAGNSHFGGDPELGRTIRGMAHYEEFRERPADEDVLIDQARCGLCYVTPREALIHATVQWWWRNRDIAGKVAISRAGNTLHVPRIVEDLLIEVRPTRAIRQGEKDRTVDYLSVQEACRVLLTELPITSARFDPWNSTSIIQGLRKDTGMDVDEIPFSSPEQYKRARLVKTLLYHNALALLPGAVDPYQKRLNEWKKLQLQGKGSVRRIDHPAGGSKDLYDAESVAIWQAANHACSGVEFLISKEA